MRKSKNENENKNENGRKRKRKRKMKMKTKKKMKLTFQAVSPTESHDQSVPKKTNLKMRRRKN